MPYVKIEDGIFRNPKMMRVGSGAKILYVASICYSGASLTDGFVPANAVRSLAADIAITSTTRPVKELVGAGLWREVEDGYQVHDYLVYNESSEKVQAKRDAARERMTRRRSPDVRANNERSSCEVREPETETETETETEKGVTPPNPPAPTVHERRFGEFWTAYPKRVGKDAVRRWWLKAKPDAALLATMVKAIEVQKLSPQWCKDGGQFIPNPATWLGQGRWNDEPHVDVPASGARASPAPFEIPRDAYPENGEEMLAKWRSRHDHIPR